MLGLIFRKAQNKIQDPAKLRRLIVDLIDRELDRCLDADVKGDAYEGLLEKNAQDTKGGAGQYFTPRPLIQAIVDVMRPALARRSATRRAALVASCSQPTTTSLEHNPTSTPTRSDHLKLEALHGVEHRRRCRPALRDEPAPARHRSDDGDDVMPPVRHGRQPAADPGDAIRLVLTNPPFGT